MDYFAINEFGNTYCEVDFDVFDDGVDVFVDVDFKFHPMHTENWEEFGRIVNEVNTSKDLLHKVAIAAKKYGCENWGIYIVNPDGCGNGVLFATNNCQDIMDLGTLAECYDDCETCDRFCYSFENESPFEEKSDCPNYHRCEECYAYTYDAYGEEADYDPLWDFRCECTKINGRKDLKLSLEAEIPL